MVRPLVAVLLGTDHHRFDRLVGYAEASTSWTGADWLVQHGSSRGSRILASVPMLAADELETLLLRAQAVVTHGGPGLIMEARAAGHTPVVVPRDPAFGEHVDGHQLRFTTRIARDGLIHRATTRAEFETCLAQALIAGRRNPGATSVPPYFSIEVGRLVDGVVHGTR